MQVSCYEISLLELEFLERLVEQRFNADLPILARWQCQLLLGTRYVALRYSRQHQLLSRESYVVFDAIANDSSRLQGER